MPELELLDARLESVVRDLASGGAEWDAARTAFAKMTAAMGTGDSAGIRTAMLALRDAFDVETSERASWPPR